VPPELLVFRSSSLVLVFVCLLVFLCLSPRSFLFSFFCSFRDLLPQFLPTFYSFFHFFCSFSFLYPLCLAFGSFFFLCFSPSLLCLPPLSPGFFPRLSNQPLIFQCSSVYIEPDGLVTGGMLRVDHY
jgi:hypothetical protein